MGFHPDLGNSDFRNLRRSGRDYIDKSRLIPNVIDDPGSILLFPRPRRFGKTLNLSMLRYFFEKSDEDRADLFSGLEVWKSEAARARFQRHPVLWITFKDVKFSSFDEALLRIGREIRSMLDAHRYLLNAEVVPPERRRELEALLELRGDMSALAGALQDLSRYLSAHHGEQVVILIDEYDTPLHAAFVHGYYDRMVEFMRAFLSGGLKDNPHVYKGVITGILRVSKESIFSGLNNIEVYSMLRPRHATSFGFTEAEVALICQALGDPGLLEGVREMYNGYVAGAFSEHAQALYNPWSVLSFAASTERMLRPFWVNTSSDDLLRHLMVRKGFGLNDQMETLLRGGSLEMRLDENIVLRDVELREDALWSFLWFSGYLKTTRAWLDEQRRIWAELAIPNMEVGTVYRDIFQGWLRRGLSSSRDLERLVRALLSGDSAQLEGYLGALLLRNVSYHDPAGREPEKLYHGFILGLLVHLEDRYLVSSNQESGFGRADLLVCPRQAGQPGVVMELKVLEFGETVEHALRSALEQIEAQRYESRLEAAGASPIHRYAAVFDGKRTYVATPTRMSPAAIAASARADRNP